ncbi:MAG TPA: YdcH family protein [Burkholderiaceae bacterium]|nr:YdcH family protein [Burkholderiaceae bacterium]
MRDAESLKRRIAELQLEHRSLDLEIVSLIDGATPDELQVRRLKKRKLQLKDTIALLQMQLTPDMPA